MTTHSLAVPSGKTYLLPFTDPSKGRSFINHGFTTQSLITKRYRENTTAAAITLNFLLPYLLAFNTRLDAHIKENRELTTEEALKHMVECLGLATVNLVDVTTRVAIQTGLACLLIERPSAASNATVYLWDAYPRLPRKYYGDVVAKLGLPQFLASLFGVIPTEKDLAIFDTKAPFMNIFEDSVRRHGLVFISDIIVSSARLAITNTISKRKLYTDISAEEAHRTDNGLATAEESKAMAAIARKEADKQYAILPQCAALTLHKSIVFISRAVGAGIGNAIGGGRGEFWCEALGAIVATSYSAVLLSKAVKQSSNPSLSSSAASVPTKKAAHEQ